MQLIQTHISDRVGTITLNRPEKRNALSYELVGELKQAFNGMANEPTVRAVILSANGQSFCSGADLAYIQSMQSFDFEDNLKDSHHLRELFQLIYELPKPVVAQVQGHAIAGGAGLATVCDFVFAVPEAKFGFTEVKIGFVPALVSVFLMRKIGEGKARELLLSGNLYPAQQVLEMGMITQVVEAGQLGEVVSRFTQELIKNNSGEAIALTKKMLADFAGMGIKEALSSAARYNAEARGTADCKKGIHAFLNKEPLTW